MPNQIRYPNGKVGKVFNLLEDRSHATTKYVATLTKGYLAFITGTGIGRASNKARKYFSKCQKKKKNTQLLNCLCSRVFP